MVHARWTKALRDMCFKPAADMQIKKIAPAVKQLFAGITIASSDQYYERRHKLLKAASALAKHYPAIAAELASYALPSLANAHGYREHMAAVVTFALKHKVLKKRIIAIIASIPQRASAKSYPAT